MTSLPDPRAVLHHPAVYEFFQWGVGNSRCRERVINSYLEPSDGMRVLDIGCGPGSLIDHLPDVAYVGCDTSEPYIEQARARYGDRAVFHLGPLEDQELEPASFDRIVMMGVLHHLADDTAASILSTAADLLKADGRFVALEPCFFDRMNPIARALISRDRGEHVRNEAGYAALCADWFKVETFAEDNLLRIPYAHLVLQCSVN